MPSTDSDGSPILIITVEEAEVVKAAIGCVKALHSLGEMKIKDTDKWEQVYQKMVNFLDSVD